MYIYICHKTTLRTHVCRVYIYVCLWVHVHLSQDNSVYTYVCRVYTYVCVWVHIHTESMYSRDLCVHICVPCVHICAPCVHLRVPMGTHKFDTRDL